MLYLDDILINFWDHSISKRQLNDKLSLFCTKVSFDTSEENQLSYFQNSFEVSWATWLNKLQLKKKFEVQIIWNLWTFLVPQSVGHFYYSQTSAGNFFLTETRKCWHLHLTPNTWAIRLSLTQSKWSMEFFLDHFTHFSHILHFDRVNNGRICHILCVKLPSFDGKQLIWVLFLKKLISFDIMWRPF